MFSANIGRITFFDIKKCTDFVWIFYYKQINLHRCVSFFFQFDFFWFVQIWTTFFFIFSYFVLLVYIDGLDKRYKLIFYKYFTEELLENTLSLNKTKSNNFYWHIKTSYYFWKLSKNKTKWKTCKRSNVENNISLQRFCEFCSILYLKNDTDKYHFTFN